MHIPKVVIVVGTVVLIGAWFVLDSDRSVLEKLAILSVLIFLYVAYHLLTGSTLDEIIFPIVNFFKLEG